MKTFKQKTKTFKLYAEVRFNTKLDKYHIGAFAETVWLVTVHQVGRRNLNLSDHGVSSFIWKNKLACEEMGCSSML